MRLNFVSAASSSSSSLAYQLSIATQSCRRCDVAIIAARYLRKQRL